QLERDGTELEPPGRERLGAPAPEREAAAPRRRVGGGGGPERGRHHRDPGSDVAPEPSRARDPPDPDRAGRLAAAAGRTLRPHQVTSGSGPPMTGSSLVAGSRTVRSSPWAGSTEARESSVAASSPTSRPARSDRHHRCSRIWW